jgi:hypothetical protein
MDLKPLPRGYFSAHAKGAFRDFVAIDAKFSVIPYRIQDLDDLPPVGDGSSFCVQFDCANEDRTHGA